MIFREKRSKKQTVPSRVQRVVDRCKTGERLCKSFFLKNTGTVEVEFHFEPSGKRCGPKSAEQAIKMGLLSPLGDGLFGNETSQQFGAAQDQ